MWNNRGPADVRRVFTGKDALLFDESGTLLATCETFQGQVNVIKHDIAPVLYEIRKRGINEFRVDAVRVGL